jgi:hypothetical protein
MASTADVLKELERKGYLDLSANNNVIKINGINLKLPQNSRTHRARDLATWAERQLQKINTKHPVVTIVQDQPQTQEVIQDIQRFVKAVVIDPPVISDGPDGLVVIAAVPEGTTVDTEELQTQADAASGKKPRRRKKVEAETTEADND